MLLETRRLTDGAKSHEQNGMGAVKSYDAQVSTSSKFPDPFPSLLPNNQASGPLVYAPNFSRNKPYIFVRQEEVELSVIVNFQAAYRVQMFRRGVSLVLVPRRI